MEAREGAQAMGSPPRVTPKTRNSFPAVQISIEPFLKISRMVASQRPEPALHPQDRRRVPPAAAWRRDAARVEHPGDGERGLAFQLIEHRPQRLRTIKRLATTLLAARSQAAQLGAARLRLRQCRMIYGSVCGLQCA